jgi:hypothetical protein
MSMKQWNLVLTAIIVGVIFCIIAITLRLFGCDVLGQTGTNTFGVFIDPCCRYVAYVGKRWPDDFNVPIAIFTNVVSGWCHWDEVLGHTNDCILIRYRDTGVTNEFHAWMTPVLFMAMPKTKESKWKNTCTVPAQSWIPNMTDTTLARCAL